MADPKPITPDFGAAARGENQARDGMPAPEQVASSGIKTREAIDWLSREEPNLPAPTRTIDDDELRRDAEDRARADLKERAQALRDGFLERSRKSRVDFETARDWRGPAQERER